MSSSGWGSLRTGVVSPRDSFLTTGVHRLPPAPAEVLQILLTAPPLPKHTNYQTSGLSPPGVYGSNTVPGSGWGDGLGEHGERRDEGQSLGLRESPGYSGIGWEQMLFRTQQRRQR